MQNADQQIKNSSRKIILHQFKERIGDCQLSDRSDEYLCKWLTARNYELDEAEQMLRQSLEWRKLNHVDQIFETFEPPKVIKEYYSMGVFGHDKMGCPIWFSAQGRLDKIGLLRSITKKDASRYFIWLVEEMARTIAETKLHGGKGASQQTVIFDMEGLSLRQMLHKPAVEVELMALRLFESNYPENLRRAFVINAPKLFTIVFNIVKPCLHQATVNKVRIYGANKAEWLNAILDEVDADQLPAFYGGTMSDPNGDPKCPSKFNMGGQVPREYYLSNSAPVPRDDMESMHIIAGAGGKKKLKFKVNAVNSVLRWEFISEGGDIGFRVYRKTLEDGIIDLIPSDRVESHLVMEEGEITCEHVGKYVVEFDNTYSYVKPKKIRYLISVEPPKKKV